MDGIVKKASIQDISDAIKTKNGCLYPYTPEMMPEAIIGLSTYGIDTPIDDLISGTATGLRNLTVTKINHNFKGYTNLQYIDLPNATNIGYQAFYECSALNYLNLPSATTLSNEAFYKCSALQHIILPNVTKINSNCFAECTNLKKIEFNSQVTFNGDHIFSGCTNLTTVILRYNGVCPISDSVSGGVFASASGATPITSGTGYVYVPEAYLAAYQKNTRWSVYGTKNLRAIEHYPDICG